MSEQRKTMLLTVAECIEIAGGPIQVAKLFGYRHPTAVYNQRDRNRFPSETYVAWQEILAAKGMTAPASLWGQAEVPVS